MENSIIPEIYYAIFAASIALLGTLLVVFGFLQSYIIRIPNIFDNKFSQELEKKNTNALFNSIYLIGIGYTLLSIFELICIIFKFESSVYVFASGSIFSLLLFGYFIIFFRIKKLL